MNFREAESYLFSLGNEVSAMKLGLENIGKLLNALGDPQKKYLKVQVAGTNGKGSVCAFLDSICNTAGIRTGTFTSPHLVSITERIRINGEDISEEEFARHATLVRETAERLVEDSTVGSTPTFFEQITAIALTAFADANVEVAILETGLGGRLDATTAANAEIAAITRIDLDHQEYLGETIEEIAAEKAAIIGQHTKSIIIGEQKPEAEAVIRKRIDLFRKKGGDEKPNVYSTAEPEKYFRPCPFDSGILGLMGRHQIENAKTAILVAYCLQDCFSINEKIILDGLQNVRHPGRLEYQGKYLFDGAHNVGAAIVLAIFLGPIVINERRPITVVFGAMGDKQVFDTMAIILPWARHIILTTSQNARAMRGADLAKQMPETIRPESLTVADTVPEAISIAENITSDDGIILVTGSLYLVGEAKKLLNQDPEFDI